MDREHEVAWNLFSPVSDYLELRIMVESVVYFDKIEYVTVGFEWRLAWGVEVAPAASSNEVFHVFLPRKSEPCHYNTF